MAHYVHDEKNNRIEALSKEETYALLAEAIQEGELPSVDEDTAFVTMFKSIVDGKAYKMGFCTQAQYNQLEAQGLLVADAYYIITDDTTLEDILAEIPTLVADKVDQEYADETVTQSISNNSSGLILYKSDYSSNHSPIGKVKLNTDGVELQGESYNHGVDDVTYTTKLVVTPTTIYILRDLGDGNAESYDLINKINKVMIENIIVNNNVATITQAGLYKVTCQSTSYANTKYTTMLSIDDLSVLDGGGQYFAPIKDTAEIRATKSSQDYIINRTSTSYDIVDVKLIVKY